MTANGLERSRAATDARGTGAMRYARPMATDSSPVARRKRRVRDTYVSRSGASGPYHGATTGHGLRQTGRADRETPAAAGSAAATRRTERLRVGEAAGARAL